MRCNIKLRFHGDHRNSGHSYREFQGMSKNEELFERIILQRFGSEADYVPSTVFREVIIFVVNILVL